MTDSSGRASTTFYSGYFWGNETYDEVEAIAIVEEYNLEGKITIKTYVSYALRFPPPEAIPSDILVNNSSTITARVTHMDGYPIQGMLVYFKLTKGNCILAVQSCLTDTEGYAHSVLIPREPGTNEVEVTVPGLGTQTVVVMSYNIAPRGYWGRPVRGTQRLLRDCVNTACGNLSFTVQDFSIPGRGPYIRFFRTYNGLSSYFGPLGGKWTHNYNMRLFEFEDGTGDRGLFDEHGGVKRFKAIKQPSGDWKFESPSGVYLKLEWDYAENKYKITDKSGTKYYFSTSSQPNSYGGLEKIVDKNGYTTTLNYNMYGYVSNVVDPSGRTLSFSYMPVQRGPGHKLLWPEPVATAGFPTGNIYYDTWGQHPEYTSGWVQPAAQEVPEEVPVIVQITLSAGGYSKGYNFTYTQYEAQQDHMLTSITCGWPNPPYDPLYKATYEYDGTKRDLGYPLTSIDDPHAQSGNTKLKFAYDPLGRVTQIQDYSGNPLVKLEYTLYREPGSESPCTRTKITQVRNPGEEYTTIDDYDSQGFQIRITDPLGYTSECKWDENLNRIWIKDKRWNTTNFAYDERGNCIQTTDALGYVTKREYEPTFNNLTLLTDAKEGITKYEYDHNGNLTKVIERYNQTGEKTTEYKYEDINHPGDCTRMIDANLHEISYEYDDYGNQKKVVMDPGGLNIETKYEYDALSRLKKITDPEGKITEYEWNSWDKKTKVKYQEETRTTEIKYEYDERGRRKAIVDQLSHRTEFEYDDFDQLTKERRYKDGGAVEVIYTYDFAGNKKTMTDPEGKITKYKYDASNRLIEMEDPMGRKTTYGYYINPWVTSDRPLTYTIPTEATFTLNMINSIGSHSSVEVVHQLATGMMKWETESGCRIQEEELHTLMTHITDSQVLHTHRP